MNCEYSCYYLLYYTMSMLCSYWDSRRDLTALDRHLYFVSSLSIYSSLEYRKMNKLNKTILYFGAAFSTGIGGVLHLVLVPNSIVAGIEYSAFFLISGVAQLFWVLPMIKRWGRIWYIVGIGGTAIMVGLTGYTLANIAADPQSAPPGITELAVTIEIFQVSYVIITGIIIAKSRRE